MLPSDDPDASLEPSGLKATISTVALLPDRTANTAPLVIFHSRMLPSDDPDANILPSGLKETE